jgi:hypothetical protein
MATTARSRATGSSLSRLGSYTCPYTATGPDMFEALVRLRRQLEPDGLMIAVQGARRDTYPSGMARDVGQCRLLRRSPPPPRSARACFVRIAAMTPRGPTHDRGNSAAYLLLYFHENENPCDHAATSARATPQPVSQPAHGPHAHREPLRKRHWDMGGGMQVYVMRAGRRARREDLVETLGNAPADHLATVDEQRAFAQARRDDPSKQ